MVKVYGASDDLVEIYGSTYKENEIGCFEKDVRIRFTDGTVIRIGYAKPELAVWWIIDAEIRSHSVIKQKYKVD